MRVLIVGYGSIGRRHEEVLTEINNNVGIELVTKQDIPHRRCYKTLFEIDDLEQYDYYIISSETNKHYEQLKFLEKNLKNKLIFCEKPLFDKYKKLEINNNQVVVGYVLRFHPLMQKIKKCLKGQKVININAKCGSYLPNWRQNIDYRDSSSAKKIGGGVLLDLSHEIDYIEWLCGSIESIKSIQSRVSDLEIESDDLVVAIGKTSEDVIFNLSIDYFSKIPHRTIVIDTIEKSYLLNLIQNEMIIMDKEGIKDKVNCTLEGNDIFIAMHNSILLNQNEVSSYKEAKRLMKVIDLIQKENNE